MNCTSLYIIIYNLIYPANKVTKCYVFNCNRYEIDKIDRETFSNYNLRNVVQVFQPGNYVKLLQNFKNLKHVWSPCKHGSIEEGKVKFPNMVTKENVLKLIF